MESTTTTYYFVPGNYSDERLSPHMIDDTDKTAYLAAVGTLIVLTFLLNVAVIAGIVYLYVKRPAVTNQAPHFIPVLACCVAEILQGVCDSVLFNMLRVRRYGESFGLSCGEEIALELSYFILTAPPLLLVAAVIFTQAVRLQSVMTLTRVVQKVVAVVLVVLSVLYVAVVVIPVFFMAFLEDHTEMCKKDWFGKEYLAYQSELSKRRVAPAVEYIVPSLFILLSCVVLLLAHFVPNKRTTITATPADPSPPSSTASPSFPFNVLLAAASCIILVFVNFLYQFQGSWVGLTRSRVWLAGNTLEKLNGVFLPCFWLLDADIRALWCCCKNATRGSFEIVTLESSEGRRIEDGGDDMKKTRC